MIVATLIFLFLLTGLGYYFSRDLFAPFVIAPAVWGGILLLYLITPPHLFPIQNQYPTCLVIWIFSFFIASVLTTAYINDASKWSQDAKPNKWIIYIYMTLSAIAMPIISFIYVKQAYLEDPENLFRYLRTMSVGVDESIEKPNLGILNYIVTMCYIALFFALIYFKNKKLIVLIFILNFMYVLVTMSKTSLLYVLLTPLFILYHKQIIKKKHLLYSAVIFFLLTFVFQSLRMGSSDEGDLQTVETGDFLSMYLMTSGVAFDYYATPFSAPSFGANTFRFFYAIGYPLGICEEPINTILPFVSVPEVVNTYTTLYPFYTDFGIIGIIVFAIIYGIGYGYLYKKAMTGSKIGLIMYAIFLTFLFLEFIGEFIFTNMSMQIQYIFYALLPFLFGEHKNEKPI